MLAERLPMLPSRSLDPVLDATVVCVVRHGLSKTSLSDIARELGVAPSTVYRKVGSVENATMLVAAREGHRLLERMPEVIAGIEGPRVITVFLAESIRATAAHPMVRRIVEDEADWVGRVATRRLADSLDNGAAVAAPHLAQALVAGQIRSQDPLALAHWIVRIGMTCLVAPPPGDLLEALDHLLLPVLDPAGAPAPRPTPTPTRTAPASAKRGGRR
jgi:AcrR family transcriptional regulator